MTLNIEEIKARLGAATPGPWEVDEYIHSVITTHPEHQEVSESYVGYHNGICNVFDGEYIENSNKENDATFIANTPTDIAALVDAVEKRQSLINKIKAVCEQSNNSDGAYILRLIEDMEGDVKSE